jgi:PAS domain S-box-containing protein
MENTVYKVLLIEDNQIDQLAFNRMVEDSYTSYDVVIANCVKEAQVALAENKFDVVLSDYILGDGTAFDIISLVKDAPIIIITGAGDENVAIKAWQEGAYDYIVKDFDLKYLKAIPIAIKNALTHKQIERKLKNLISDELDSDNCVYVTDLEDAIIFVNKAFCCTYGYRDKDIVGKHSCMLWKNSIQNTEADNINFYHLTKDGQEFPVSLTKSMVCQEDGQEIAAVNTVELTTGAGKVKAPE